jgi:hypothetical protein
VNDVTDADPDSARGPIGEFAYAVPAGLVIFLHLIVALAALLGVITGISRQGYALPTAFSPLISLAVLITALAGTALSIHLWSRRSWWILAVPAVMLPGALIGGLAYAYLNWGY